MNKMRRLPGPACCRLSEGDHSLEALYELFRDWQRTQTQSSVTALQGPRQLMDVWFCRAQEAMPRGTECGLEHPGTVDSHALASVPGTPWLRLTDDLHGGRQIGSWPIPRFGLCKISSAVSAVLRCENFSCADAAGAEPCGYGDLR